MRVRIVGVLAFLALIGFAARAAEPADAGGPFREFVAGDAKAKVAVIAYVSLTCPHCAHFHTATYPQLKKAYVDTGKVRFLLRDFPLDALAMAGAVIARCASPEKGRKLVDLLFENQMAWVASPRPIEPLRAQAKAAGLSEADVDACLQNKTLLASMKEEQRRASDVYAIDATPAFFIGDETIQGDAPFEDMAAAIDRQLAKAKKK
jgi:protein-disulfide isomerase